MLRWEQAPTVRLTCTDGLEGQVVVWLVPEAVGMEKSRTNVMTSKTNLDCFILIVCEGLLNLSGL